MSFLVNRFSGIFSPRPTKSNEPDSEIEKKSSTGNILTLFKKTVLNSPDSSPREIKKTEDPRQKYLMDLGETFRELVDVEKPSPRFITMLKQYPYKDIVVQECLDCGWSKEQICVLIDSSPVKVSEVNLGTCDVNLDSFVLPKGCKVFSMKGNRSSGSDEALQKIMQSGQLEEINLESTYFKLEKVQFPSTSKKINLYGNCCVNNENFALSIENCNQLTELNLGATRLSLKGVKLPKTCAKVVLCRNIELTNASLQALLDSKTITDLDISNIDLTLEGVVFSQNFKRIVLSNNTALTDEALNKSLKLCEVLEELDVSGTTLTLRDIVFQESLEYFSIAENTTVTTIDLKAAIYFCINLKKLKISMTKIDLKDMQLSANLKELDCTGCGIPKGNIQKALKNCKSCTVTS